MSALHLVFDGYHLQKAFRSKVRRAIRGEEVQAIRNAIARIVRHDVQGPLPTMRTTFVTGRVGPLITNQKHRDLIDRNILALNVNEIVSIDFVFHDLVPGLAKPFVQQEHLCDGTIVETIDAARGGDTIAVCTVDGKLMSTGEGTVAPGIAEALRRARGTKNAEVWLITFKGGGQKPGPALLGLLADDHHVSCAFVRRGTKIKLVMRWGSSIEWLSLSARSSALARKIQPPPMFAAA